MDNAMHDEMTCSALIADFDDKKSSPDSTDACKLNSINLNNSGTSPTI